MFYYCQNDLQENEYLVYEIHSDNSETLICTLNGANFENEIIFLRYVKFVSESLNKNANL